MSLAKLAGRVASTSFEYDGETVNLRFYPERLTPVLMSQIAEVAGLADLKPEEAATVSAMSRVFGMTEPALAAIIDVVCTLLESWDVQGDDGKPYPITHENLQVLPIPFLLVVMSAMQEAMSPVQPGEAPATSKDS